MSQRMSQRSPLQPAPAVEDWAPGRGTLVLWLLLSLALTIAATAAFTVAYVAAHGEIVFRLDGAGAVLGLLVIAGLSGAVMALHEVVHGLTMRRFGARPTYGAEVAGKLVPVLYCTAVGHRFTRRAYVVVALAPLVVLSALGALLIALLPVGVWLILPLGFHAGGAIGDLWVSVLTARRPAGTLVEDRRSGARFYLPISGPGGEVVPPGGGRRPGLANC